MFENRKRRSYMNESSQIECQKNSNWCTNHACSSVLESLFARVYGKITPLSNSWGMMLCKKNNYDNRPEATGTSFKAILNRICKYGMATEEDYPTWDDKDVNDNKFPKASTQSYDNALKFKPTGFKEINDIDVLLDAINNNGGAVCEVRLYQGHISPNNGFVEIKQGQESKGLHAIKICGYDLDLERQYGNEIEKGFLILEESYDKNRGFKGYLYVPISYFINGKFGKYSFDKYFKSVYAFEYAKEMPFKTFFNSTQAIVPRRVIELIVGQTTASIDGVEAKMQCPAKIIDGRTLIPLRFVGEALNCSVMWYGGEKKVKLYDQKRNILAYVWINSTNTEISKRGKQVNYTMLSAPIIDNGYTMIPIRDACMIMDAKIDFDGKTKKITIETIL